MQPTGATTAQRLHALTVISTALVRELKEGAANLNAFSDSPKGSPMSPMLSQLSKAAAFCGFWGAANYLGALCELAKRIETIPVQEVERAEYLDRVRTLAAGINALGVYLRDLSAGTAVSYAALNDAFARVIRKVHPSLLSMSPVELAPSLFMPAPPSLEVDAQWVPGPDASLESLCDVLEQLHTEGITEERLRRAAAVNPMRTLSGMLEVAAIQAAVVASPAMAADAREEFGRLLKVLSSGQPASPPMPAPFIFSRLLHALASSTSQDATTRSLRRRYSLTKPGTNVSSMHDVARKFADGMKRFQDAYFQGALSKTPSSISKMAAQMAEGSHKLESEAFTTYAAALRELTAGWGGDGPDMDGWVYGAALVLLMREAAETWGHQDAQESLAGLADIMAGSQRILQCETMQKSMRAVAVQKAVDALAADFVEVNRAIETSLRSVGHGDIEGAQADRVAEVLGTRVAEHMATIAGVARCMKLTRAAEFAEQLHDRAARPAMWASNAERMALFEEMSRLNLFLARLRPGSMLDMEPDEQAELDVEGSARAAEATEVAVPVLEAEEAPDASEVVEPMEVLEAAAVERAAEVPDSAVAYEPAEPAQAQLESAPMDIVGDLDDLVLVGELDIGDELPEGNSVPTDANVSETAGAVEVEPAQGIEEPNQQSAVEARAAEVGSTEVASDAPSEKETAVVGAREEVSTEPLTEAPVADAPVAEESVDEQPVDFFDSLAASPDVLDETFSFDTAPELLAAMPTELTSLSADELEREFIGAQEGRSQKLDTDDHELLTIMFEESWQCMEDIDRALAQAKLGGQAAAGTVPEARRHIHTLKGVCRTCGLDAPGATLHAMEDRLEVMPDDGLQLSTIVAPFESAMALVRSQLEAARSLFLNGGSEEPSELPQAATTEEPVIVSTEDAHLVSRLAVLDASEGAVQAEEVALESEVSGAAQGLTEAAVMPEAAPLQVAMEAAPAEVAPVAAARASAPARQTAAGGTVRIPVQLAGRLGEASGQVVTASRRAVEDQGRRARAMRELDDNLLKRMGPAIRELEMTASTSIASSRAHSGAEGFDPLELDRYTAMQEVVRRLVEAFEDTVSSAATLSEALKASSTNEHQLAELTDDLQRGSSELLLVPVSSQQARLERVVAKACTDAGKEAVLVIEQGCRVPAAALDKLMPVFEHILRNALAHGIENSDSRKQEGKAPVGRIVIAVPATESAEGGVVRVSVRDDGAGIDLERVRAIARKRGLIKADAQLSDDAVRELLFMPGFSTANAVSELAGRGVGLDVVRSAMSSLGGVVGVQSTRGQGTEFTLTLPSDSASMSVVPVSAGGFKCLLPLMLVRRIVPVSAGAEVVVDVASGKATISGVEYELIDMAARVPAVGAGSRAGRGHLVLMRESNVARAVLVDQVGQQTRVVTKPLGPFVRDIPGMVAGTTMAAGGSGLVVNPLQLAEISRGAAEVPASRSGVTKVMVVDDSSTVRLVTSRFLKRSGYAVEVARDGLDALQQLAKGAVPDVFLFDLEMPGMNGFELIAEVRRKPEFKSTPIVVITSRSAEKHRERAMQLGATAYLAKPYEDAQLLEVLGGLVGVAA